MRSDNFFVENAKHRQINAWPHALRYTRRKKRKRERNTERWRKRVREQESRDSREVRERNAAVASVWALNGA